MENYEEKYYEIFYKYRKLKDENIKLAKERDYYKEETKLLKKHQKQGNLKGIIIEELLNSKRGFKNE